MEKVVWLRGYVPTVSGFEITEPGLEYGGVVFWGAHDYEWCVLLTDFVAISDTDAESCAWPLRLRNKQAVVSKVMFELTSDFGCSIRLDR